MREGCNLSFRYGSSLPWIFRSLSIQLAPGEIVGLYGPSGQGKSTLAKVLAGYLTPLSGSVHIGTEPLEAQRTSPVQLLFQHPELAINPRWKVKKVVSEGYTPSSAMLKISASDKTGLTDTRTSFPVGSCRALPLYAPFVPKRNI